MGRPKKFSKIMAYDSEAYRFQDQDFLQSGVFVWKEGGEYKRKVITNKEQFRQFIEDLENVRIYIQNLKYDASLIDILSMKDHIKAIFLDNPRFVEFQNGVQLVDVMNYFNNASLETLQKTFLTEADYRELGIPYNYKENTPYQLIKENPKEWNRWISINGTKLAYYDALTLLRIMEKVTPLLSLGSNNLSAISLAQVAMKAVNKIVKETYRDNKQLLKDYFRLGDPFLNAFEVKQSYKGGIVFPFKVRPYSVMKYGYDVNSLYPKVMHDYIYPYKLYKITESQTIDPLKLYQDNRVGIHLVQWVCTNGDPILPIITRLDNDDRKVTTMKRMGLDWITTPELEGLMQECDVKVIKSFIYDAFPLFRGFVDYYYKLKQESKGDPVKYTIYKIILNSGYGKFGQMKERRQIVDDEELIEALKESFPEGQERFRYDGIVYSKLSDDFYTYRVQIEPKYKLAVASIVTGYARRYIYEIMKLIGKDKVEYTDTDSIFTTVKNPISTLNFRILGVLTQQPFLDDKLLGSMKLEKQGYMNHLAKKLYLFSENEGDWYPKGFKLVGSDLAEGYKNKYIVMKGVPLGSYMTFKWNNVPFEWEIRAVIEKVNSDWRKVENETKHYKVNIHQRLRYEKEGDYWQGYPL